jgi:hypothetical protein
VKFRMALTVVLVAAGLVSVWFRPAAAGAIVPLMGAAVGYWFGGKPDGSRGDQAEVSSGGASG